MLREALARILRLKSRHRFKFHRLVKGLQLVAPMFCGTSVTVRLSVEGRVWPITLALLGEQIHIWGLTSMIFPKGQIPGGLPMLFLRRNEMLHKCNWGHWRDAAHDLFGISAVLDVENLTVAELKSALQAVKDEMAYCQRCLDQSSNKQSRNQYHDRIDYHVQNHSFGPNQSRSRPTKKDF